jgi:hypothetical protein
MKKAMTKWTLLAVLASGSVFNGCLNSFWQGFWNDGWPNNLVWQLGLDIANEAIFG